MVHLIWEPPSSILPELVHQQLMRPSEILIDCLAIKGVLECAAFQFLMICTMHMYDA